MKILIKLFIIILFSFSCVKSTSSDDLSKPIYFLSSYNFNPDSKIEHRISKAPEFLISHLQKMDNRKDYEPYILSDDEKSKVLEYIELLPDLNKKIIKQRLVGIFFIKNLLGSGFTDFIYDEKKEFYFYIAINPVVFKKNISELLTYREMSCFIKDDQKIEIKIDSGNKYSGLLYILIHETTHGVDYASFVTPYVENAITKLKDIKKTETNFTKNIWKSYNQTIKNFSFRKNLTFYGIGGGPKILISESIKIYKDFEKSYFASLYASLNWAEDLADFITFFHLTQKLKEKYKIIIFNNNTPIYFFEPFNSINRLKRGELIKFFYN